MGSLNAVTTLHFEFRESVSKIMFPRDWERSNDKLSSGFWYSWVVVGFFLSVILLCSCRTNKRARSSIFDPVPVNFIAGAKKRRNPRKITRTFTSVFIPPKRSFIFRHSSKYTTILSLIVEDTQRENSSGEKTPEERKERDTEEEPEE